MISSKTRYNKRHTICWTQGSTEKCLLEHISDLAKHHHSRERGTKKKLDQARGIYTNNIYYLIWNSKVLDCVTTDITFRHSPKPISVLQRNKAVTYLSVNHTKSKQMNICINNSTYESIKKTFDVQMTSRRWMFIHVSQFTKCPLYVSPFLSSTSYKHNSNHQNGFKISEKGSSFRSLMQCSLKLNSIITKLYSRVEIFTYHRMPLSSFEQR